MINAVIYYGLIVMLAEYKSEVLILQKGYEK